MTEHPSFEDFRSRQLWNSGSSSYTYEVYILRTLATKIHGGSPLTSPGPADTPRKPLDVAFEGEKAEAAQCTTPNVTT